MEDKKYKLKYTITLARNSSSFNTKLDNSGSSLSQDNYNIVANNEYFSLILYDKNKNIYATYSFYYNDLINIKG